MSKKTTKKQAADLADVRAVRWFMESYAVVGPAHVLYGRSGVVVASVRSVDRAGAGWFRFVRKVSAEGWHATHHKTRRQAMAGFDGR